MTAVPHPEQEPQPGRASLVQRLVLKNAAILLVAQGATVPLAVALHAMMARYLGPEDYGYVYLASTLATFGVLAVDWGTGNVLAAAVARDRSSVRVMLGSTIMYRVAASVVVFGGMIAVCWLLGHDKKFLAVLALSLLGWAFATIGSACQDAVRGFERSDVTAIAGFSQSALNLVGVVPVLLLGGRLQSVLAVQAITPLLLGPYVIRSLKSVGAWPPQYDWGVCKSMLQQGTAFVALGVAMVLQPNVDAFMLQHYAPVEVVGWYAVARKLIGLLIYPAGALIGALYPTLARLHAHQDPGFKETLSSTICLSAVFVGPAAFGCLVYPELGVSLLSSSSFGPAADNLRILSAFLPLVYFTMVVGTGLIASGLQRAWAWCQGLCVVVSVVLNPLLIPWFQDHYHNGGLGVSIASVASEVLMLGCGVWLMPRGVLNKTVLRPLLSVLFSGIAMALVAFALRGLPSLVAAPIALVVYGIVLWKTGGVNAREQRAIRYILARKANRAA